MIAIHKRHELAPNPLYLMGATRVGCWPCIYARKSEIRLIADVDPGRIVRIAALEERVAKAAQERYERDRTAWQLCPDAEPAIGTDAHERWTAKRDRLMRPFTNPAWFQSQRRAGDGKFPTLPIAEAVEWSRTSFGWRQFEMFAADPADAGCMRWGLCETDKPEST